MGRAHSFLAGLWLCLALLPLSAMAADPSYVCEALQNPEVYSGGRKSYRYLVQGKDGWIFRSETDFKQDFTVQSDMLEMFWTLHGLFQKNNATLVLLLPPTRPVIHPSVIPPVGEGKMPAFDSQKAAESYIDFINTMKFMGLHVVSFEDRIPLNPSKTQFFYRRDHHWTAAGAGLAAEKVAALVKALPGYATFPKQKFVTRDTGKMVAPEASFAGFIGRICEGKLPEEAYPERLTVAVNEGKSASAEDLFGEKAGAPVAVVGTSNCVEGAPSYANFVGALRQQLSTDVDNLSIGGAGFGAPMISYLNSGQLGKHSVVIWEMATHYDFNTKAMHNMMRELIPAAMSFCPDSEAAAHASLPTVDDTQFTVLDGLEDKMDEGKDYYVALRSGAKLKGPVVVDSVRVSYRPETYTFDRSSRYPHDGVYFLTLKKAKTRRVSALEIILPPEAVGQSFEARVCPIVR